MRLQDRRIFSECAVSLKLWILVRRTNPKSLDYVGRAGFIPKPIECKAKTADEGSQAGLVVSADVLPNVFEPQKRGKALRIWEDFVIHHLGKDGFDVDADKNSPRYGCLRQRGKYIYGDYDLYDIVLPDQANRNLALVGKLHDQDHRRGPKFYEVQRFINSRIGAPMVQHGGEAQFTDHSEQILDAFGPQGEQDVIMTEAEVRAWYLKRFGDRRTLAGPSFQTLPRRV